MIIFCWHSFSFYQSWSCCLYLLPSPGSLGASIIQYEVFFGEKKLAKNCVVYAENADNADIADVNGDDGDGDDEENEDFDVDDAK